MSIRKGNDIIASKPLIDAVPTQSSTNAVSSGGVYDALATKQATISDLATIRAGAAAGATAVQPGDNVSDLANDAGYLVMSDLTNFVTRTTAQTISGLKTFSADIVLSGTTSIKNTTNGVSYTMVYRDTSGIHVGTSTQALLLAGSGTHPSFNGNNLALLSEIPTVPTTLAALTGDVDISSPTNGQHLVYDGTKWKNTNSAATVSWGGIGGTLSDQTDLQNALDAKANVDMDNLTDTGKNISNWSSNVTNCITEIPNDIKMELNTTTHTLTVKAGTKVYIPNGAGVFDTLTLDTDTSTAQTLSTQMNRFVCITTAGALYTALMTGGTVTSRPTTPINYALYYNTTTNVCEVYNGSQWIQLSFPIGIIMQDSTGVIRLLNVFNGFGYIGSTLFALPGTKGLIANGFNPDGTMKNTFWETENVIIRTLANTVNSADAMILFNGIAFSIMRVGATNYDSATNTIIRTSLPFDVFPYTYVCQCVITAGVISGFGNVVRACVEPKGEINRRSIIQRQNGNPWYIKYADGFVIQGGYVNNLTTTSQRVTFPVPMNGTNYTVALGAYIANATPQTAYIRSNLNSTGFDYKAGAATIDRACWIVAGVYA